MPMTPWKRGALLTLAVGVVLLVWAGLLSPMLLIFPMWIGVALGRRPLMAWFGRWPRGWGVVLAGVVFGMAVEVFAIVDNLPRPPAERILLDGDPAKDLLLGLGYYTSVMLAWYAMLRRVRFSPREVFVITGLYGLVVEQDGRVLQGLWTHPLLGSVFALWVMTVYGVFPMLALQVAGHTLPEARRPSSWRTRALALAALFLQYVLYGTTLYRWLKALW